MPGALFYKECYGVFTNDKMNLLKQTETWTAPSKNKSDPPCITLSSHTDLFLPNNFQLDQFPDTIPCIVLRLLVLAHRRCWECCQACSPLQQNTLW